MSLPDFDLYLKGYVGGWDFDADFIEWAIAKHGDSPMNVLISSLGGQLDTAMKVCEAFRRHGNVTVHFSGMNASAATIAGMGAKRITIDSTALWLVHGSSYFLDIFQQTNAEGMEGLIEYLHKEKADLDTFDKSISLLYAERCRKSAEDLKALMKEDKWITAQEALEWGFVDEVITSEASAKVPESVVCAMKENGLPIPRGIGRDPLFARIQSAVKEALTLISPNIESKTQNNNNPTTMSTETPQSQAQEAPQAAAVENPANAAATPETDLQEQLNAALARIEALEAQLLEQPGDTTAAVIAADSEPKPLTAETAMERFHKEIAAAKDLYNSLP